jgi:hypothetical protein
MEEDSTETREVERLDSRRLEMDLHRWSLRVLGRIPELTSTSSSSLPAPLSFALCLSHTFLFTSKSQADIRPSAHGGQTKDGGQDDRKSLPNAPWHMLMSRN